MILDKNKLKRAAFIFFIFGAVMALLRSVMVVRHIEINAYDSKAYTLPDGGVFTAFAVAAALFCALLGVFTLAKCLRTACLPDKTDPLPAGATLACALALFCQAALFAVYALEKTVEVKPFAAIAAALALLSSLIYFLPPGVQFMRGVKRDLPASAGMLPVFYFAARIIDVFTNNNAAPMESSGAYRLLSLVAAMLFFLAEAVSAVHPTALSRFFFCGGVASVMLFIHSVPDIVLRMCGFISFEYSAMLSVCDLLFALYICVRIGTSSVGKLPKKGADGEYEDEDEDEGENGDENENGNGGENTPCEPLPGQGGAAQPYEDRGAPGASAQE